VKAGAAFANLLFRHCGQKQQQQQQQHKMRQMKEMRSHDATKVGAQNYYHT
jgi:hypothetical protein